MTAPAPTTTPVPTKTSTSTSTSTPEAAPPMTPRYLFRVWTDQSNGTNSPTLIKSAWRSWSALGILAHLSPDARYRVMKSKLQGALMGKEVTHNPYVFATCSLLYAIQHAIAKTRGNGEKNAYIICIDTQTYKRTDGRRVRFYSAVQTMRRFTVATPRARWTYDERDYSDVWVTTDNIVPGEGSYYVSYEKLKEVGLFGLFPEYVDINRRNNPGLESPVNDLRRLWYTQKRDLPIDEFTLAAQLAISFDSVCAGHRDARVPSHLLAWFVALKGQRPDGKRLARWLNSHHSRVASTASSTHIAASKVPELDRYRRILAVARRHRVDVAAVTGVKARTSRLRQRAQRRYYKDKKKGWMTGRDR